VFFLWQHPLEVARKFFTGFQQFWEAGPGVAHPVIGFLFLAALVIETEDPWMEELRAVVAGSLALGVLGSCLFRPEPTLLLAWAPLLAILGATFLTEQLESRFKGISPTGRWKRRVVCLGTVGLIGFPLFYFLAVSRPGPEPQTAATFGTLQQLLPPAATVMTNRPGPVAWYGNRRAVWLCQRQEDWEILERTVGPVEATYILPGLTQMPPDPQREWWVGLALPRGVYQGLVLAPEQPPRGVLRVRRKDE
jgi:hypothetical protein